MLRGCSVFQRLDLNGDGVVGFEDFLELSRDFGLQDDQIRNTDLNGDGVVSFEDFLLLAAYFGEEGPLTVVRG